jgi:hypothetical protein
VPLAVSGARIAPSHAFSTFAIGFIDYGTHRVPTGGYVPLANARCMLRATSGRFGLYALPTGSTSGADDISTLRTLCRPVALHPGLTAMPHHGILSFTGQ